jgi:outer membrane receptor protein involved in Fe transport
MKAIFKFFAFIFLSSMGRAQTGSSIAGQVTQGGKPLEFVSVLLYRDSTRPVASGYTDSTGKFRLINLVDGAYNLRLQLVGHQPKNMSVDVRAGDNSLGNISLLVDDTQLKSVEVSSIRRMIRKTPNGFIISAKDNLAQIGGTATDLLSTAPTVVTDPENGITIRGKAPLILINGRNSPVKSIDNIPASSIESIEIINNPSAQYDAESEGGIINITLKKNTGTGTNGSFALAAGLGARGRFNSAVLLGHQQGKWNLGLNYDNRFAGRTRAADAQRINYFLTDQYRLSQQRHDERYEQTHNLKLNADFSPDKKHSLGLEINGNIDNQDNHETLLSAFTRQNKTFNNQSSRFSNELARAKELEFALDYEQKFSDARKKLSVNLSSGLAWSRENTDINTRSLDSSGQSNAAVFLQRTHNYENERIHTLRVDHTIPVTASAVLAMGYKGTMRHIDADFLSAYMQGGSYLTDPKASNHFVFNEAINAAYLQYKGSKENAANRSFKYDIGLRAEQTHNTGTDASGKQLFSNSYLKLFPSATLSYYFSNSDFIKLGYYRRINRPGLGQLNPFIDITDSLNPHGGNPYLQPELVNALETGVTKEWEKGSVTLNVFYRHAVNSIRTLITLDNNGVALVLPQNIGTNDTYGAELIADFQPFSFWLCNASISVFRQKLSAVSQASLAENNVLAGFGKLVNNFTVWKGGKLQLLYNYTAPSATPQGTRLAGYNTDLGFQQKFNNGRAALGLAVTDLFNTQRSGVTATTASFDYYRNFKVDTRAILVSFTWSFRTKLKEELLENKFSND